MTMVRQSARRGYAATPSLLLVVQLKRADQVVARGILLLKFRIGVARVPQRYSSRKRSRVFRLSMAAGEGNWSRAFRDARRHNRFASVLAPAKPLPPLLKHSARRRRSR